MTPEARKWARDLMTAELLKNALMHDLRGAATALLGWHSLLPDTESRAYGGLGRSIAGLEETISGFGRVEPAEVVEAELHEVAGLAGVAFEGVSARAVVSAARLEVALCSSGATGIFVEREVRGRIKVHVTGLEEESIRLLLSPQSPELLEAARQMGTRIGTCLFKEVVRGVRGEYVSEGPGQLSLLLDSAG